MISPQAYVDPRARIGQNVEIKPFAYVEGDVEIGDNCVIMPYASILNGTRMGNDNIVMQNAIIGAIPQDIKYKSGDPTITIIGNRNVIREGVLIAGSLTADTATIIGDDNKIMNKVHICHDVHIHNHIVLGISVNISPECEIFDYAILSSACIVQYKARIGKFSLLQSGTRVAKDVLPYAVYGSNPACYKGVNSVVMWQVNPEWSEDIIRQIGNAFRMITAGNFSLEDAVIKIHEQISEEQEILDITDFISNTLLGIIRRTEKED